MALGWQNIMTVTLVVLAIAFVLRKLWNAVLNNKSSSSCGSCGSCSAPKEVLTIDIVKRP